MSDYSNAAENLEIFRRLFPNVKPTDIKLFAFQELMLRGQDKLSDPPNTLANREWRMSRVSFEDWCDEQAH